MAKQRKKHFSTKVRSSLGVREFNFALMSDRIEWKEKGVAGHNRCSVRWASLIGFAFIFSPKSQTIPTELRSLDVLLHAADKILEDQDFRIWFGEDGLFFGRIGVSATGVTHLTWRNVLNYGLLRH
jgi:hypothetical protein